MTKTLHCKVRGKTIKLNEDPAVAEGQEVEVQLKVVLKHPQKTGAGFLRNEGGLGG